MNPSVDSTVNEERFNCEVIGRLRKLRRRLRLYTFAEGGAVVLPVWLGLVALQLTLDYLFRLPVDMRGALLAAVLSCFLWVVVRRMWRPLRVRADMEDIARLVERRYPDLNDRLISAVEFARVAGGVHRSVVLTQSVIGQAADAVANISLEAVLNHRRAIKRLLIGGGAVCVFLMMIAARPEMMRLWFQRNLLLRNVNWPQRTYLEIIGVQEGRLRHLRGEDLALAVAVRGDRPGRVVLEAVYEDGVQSRDGMIPSGPDRFVRTLRSVGQSLQLRATGGDDETEWVPVELVDAPAVTSLALHVEPPPYAGVPAYDLREDQRALEVLRGSTISATIGVNKPVVEMSLMRGRSVVQPCRPGESPQSWHVSVRPEETAAYHFDLKDAGGFRSNRPLRFSVRVVKDQAPGVQLRLVGVGEAVVPNAVLPVELSCEDRYGLAAAALLYEVAGDSRGTGKKSFEDLPPRARQYVRQFDWSLTPLSLRAGQRLLVSAEAMDFDDVSGPNKGESAKYAIRIVTREELEAEFSRREQEYRQDFERLFSQQEELRLAILSAIKDAQSVSLEEVNSLARRQRYGVTRAKNTADQFGRLLRETQINLLSTPESERRMADGIVAPLTQLSRGEMNEAANRLDEVTKIGHVADPAAMDRQQQAIIERMRGILANMARWEGYQEVIGMLRDVVRLQDEANRDTQKATADALERFFGTEPTSAPSKK